MRVIVDGIGPVPFADLIEDRLFEKLGESARCAKLGTSMATPGADSETTGTISEWSRLAINSSSLRTDFRRRVSSWSPARMSARAPNTKPSTRSKGTGMSYLATDISLATRCGILPVCVGCTVEASAVLAEGAT